MTEANGNYSQYEYDTDPRYRTESINHYMGGSPPATLGIDYSRLGHDKVGNPLSIDYASTNKGYTYDAMNRLDSLSNPSTDYTYDWVGNMTGPEPFVYDAADRLTDWGTSYYFSYFPDGGMDEMVDGDSYSIMACTYYPSGLLEIYSQAGNDDITNYWDADANRIKVDHGEDSDPLPA